MQQLQLLRNMTEDSTPENAGFVELTIYIKLRKRILSSLAINFRNINRNVAGKTKLDENINATFLEA